MPKPRSTPITSAKSAPESTPRPKPKAVRKPTAPKKSPRPRLDDRPSVRPAIDLALQGGGSHGAFTWGVLDRLLQHDGLELSGISGTSAGALNGAVMLSGYAQGHESASGSRKDKVEAAREAARQALDGFWNDVSINGMGFTPMSLGPQGMFRPSYNLNELPGYEWLSMFTQTLSPYLLNPFNINPLRSVLERHVSIPALRQLDQQCGIKLFVAATSVRTGQAKVFDGDSLSVDALLASVCLPFMFQAVEIDGDAYWDGGYTGNPALYPLIYHTDCMDILLVKINPLQRRELPQRSLDILDRLSEITFNAGLIGEMRAIAFVQRLLRDEKIEPGRYKDLHMHMIADDEGLAPYNASSKSNTDRRFLHHLRDMGHAAADRWLHEHRQNVGHHSTMDIDETFLSLNQS